MIQNVGAAFMTPALSDSGEYATGEYNLGEYKIRPYI